MSLLSASKLELAKRCIGAFTLPWRNERNAWSDAGTERHAEDEAAINAGDTPAVLAERWPDLTWRAEVAFAYDVATGEARELGQGIGRDYKQFNLTPFEIVGTADAIGLSPSQLVVHDKKSFDDVTRASDNPQLAFLALAAGKVYLPTRIEVAISHELRDLDVAEIDPVFDLDVIAHSVKQLMLAVVQARSDARDGKPVAFNAGRQCRWCNAFDSCPKQAELLALVKRDDEALASGETVMPMLTDENAPDVYALWKSIGILHKRIGQSLYAKAADRPIPIGGGKMFGRVTKQGNEKLDGDVAYSVVRDRYGQEVADAAVQRVATKTKIKEALNAVAGRGGLAAAERSVLDEVRKRGGARRDEKESIEEFVPQLAAVKD